MKRLQQPVFVAAGYTTTFMGSGRKEFNPKAPQRPFEEYLQETAEGTSSQLQNAQYDEGVIGSFMSGRFLKQANLPGFLPFMHSSLLHRPCTAVEGACGTGARAIALGVRSVLAGLSDAVFVAGFEMQTRMKAIYGADVLAGASHYRVERKKGHAYFFPGIFAERAGAYYEKYGYDMTRQGMAKWYEQSILHARRNPKAQEFENKAENLYELGMTPPNPARFLPYINHFDCSKVSDGASSLVVLSEEGLKRCGVRREDAIEIVGIGEGEGDITRKPPDPTQLTNSIGCVERAFKQSGITRDDLACMELHDCFTITGLLGVEAVGFAKPGQAASFVLEGHTGKEGIIPTNLSGGLGGFGHPTGATGVRQMVDLWQQLTGRAPNQIASKKEHALMISMGGNDITVTAFVVRR